MSDEVEVTQAEVDAALETFAGGLRRVNDERNARGYTTHYHPKSSMKEVLANFARHRLASQGEVAELVEAAKACMTFLGKVGGSCLGLAMSGDNHPAPDAVLMALFEESKEISNDLAATLSKHKGAGQ